jgi:prepilin-type N-terminal cleavage/methylation domain-containing protein
VTTRCFHRRPCAFSLLEILVAVAVLSVLLVILLNIVQSATGLWRQSENRAEAYRESRAALQLMAANLKNSLATTNTDFFRTNLISSTNTNGLPSIGFLATQPLASQEPGNLGDVCAVGFFADYGDKSPIAKENGRQSMNLYRYFLGSNATFSALTNNGSGLFPGSFEADSASTEILARNVVRCEFRFYSTNASGGFTNWTQGPGDSRPDLVEIEITAANNERANRFGRRNARGEWADWTAETNAPDFQRNTKTFTTRVGLAPDP